MEKQKSEKSFRVVLKVQKEPPVESIDTEIFVKVKTTVGIVDIKIPVLGRFIQ